VRGDELLPLAELRRRLGLGHKGIAKAQKMGLRVTRFGKCGYVLGKSVLAFFELLEAQQHPPRGGPDGGDDPGTGSAIR